MSEQPKQTEITMQRRDLMLALLGVGATSAGTGFVSGRAPCEIGRDRDNLEAVLAQVHTDRRRGWTAVDVQGQGLLNADLYDQRGRMLEHFDVALTGERQTVELRFLSARTPGDRVVLYETIGGQTIFVIHALAAGADLREFNIRNYAPFAIDFDCDHCGETVAAHTG